MFVKVADFRNKIDHLFRVVNEHYHSCVGSSEVRPWLEICGRVKKELEETECKRATEYDHSRKALALAQAEKQIENAFRRLQVYKKENR